MVRKICDVEGCGKIVVSRGLCGTHRRRVDRHGDVNAGRPFDWGTREKHPLWNSHQSAKRSRILCDEWEELQHFISGVGGFREGYILRRKRLNEPFNPDNFQWVKKPEKTTEHLNAAAWQRENRKKNPDLYFHYELKRRFKIGIEDYEEMLFVQNHVCKICKQPESTINRNNQTQRLAVDHDHTTGKVRGLLCSNCNRGLGCFKDSLHLLQSAIQYLESHQGAHHA